MSIDSFAALRETAAARPPIAALVLGSGLNEVTDGLPCLHSIPFANIPNLPATTVLGHRGRLCLHEAFGQTVLAFQGRLHFYEGHRREIVERPVRLASELGAPILVLTNASGGIGARQSAGSLMAIRDHITATLPRWWREVNRPSPYSRRLLGVLGDAASAVGQELPAGVYACVTGPNYETSAEIRGYRAAGADAVGMSTAHEANSAAALGMEVAAVSCIANLAAGISPRPLSHTEVLATVRQAGQRMAHLINEFLRLLCIRTVNLSGPR